MQLLTNPVRRYAWGTTSAIPQLLGVEADGEPQAELWLGAHPHSPSLLTGGTRLDDAVRAEPERLLGHRVVTQFGARLPFLLKVLSAERPLSLQVHPSAAQAAAGFAAEERAGVPAGAPHRRYHDPFSKPEMLVALTPFEVLCGLRPAGAVLTTLRRLDVDHPGWPHLLALLGAPDGESVHEAALRWLLSGDPALPALLDAVVRACGHAPPDPALRTVTDLASDFPGDAGVLVSLLLHRVSLSPGQALHLPAGNVHAYLCGTALEVMASSDNVLRAGLTAKHVDVDELLRLVHFTPGPVPWVEPQQEGPLAWYRPGADEFELLRVRLDGGEGWVDVAADGPRVVLVLSGEVEVRTGTPAPSLSAPGPSAPAPSASGPSAPALSTPARRGQSFFVPHADGPLAFRGRGEAVVVAVPQAPSLND